MTNNPSPSPSEELKRLALVLTSDVDARADMIDAIGRYRSAARADELAEAMLRIISA